MSRCGCKYPCRSQIPGDPHGLTERWPPASSLTVQAFASPSLQLGKVLQQLLVEDHLAVAQARQLAAGASPENRRREPLQINGWTWTSGECSAAGGIARAGQPLHCKTTARNCGPCAAFHWTTGRLEDRRKSAGIRKAIGSDLSAR